MNAVTNRSPMTPEDLLALPNEKDFELVDGKLIERGGSALTSWIGGNVLGLIGDRLDRVRLGWFFGAGIGC